jgi:hypothetical protein
MITKVNHFLIAQREMVRRWDTSCKALFMYICSSFFLSYCTLFLQRCKTHQSHVLTCLTDLLTPSPNHGMQLTPTCAPPSRTATNLTEQNI